MFPSTVSGGGAGGGGVCNGENNTDIYTQNLDVGLRSH
jgi:hypothetical protein